MYALKYILWGQGISLVVLKATTSELIGPKKKHLNYLVAMSNEPNVSIPSMVKHLIFRARHPDWPVTFKALITIHHLTTYGNEKFIQNVASSVANSKAIESLCLFSDQSNTLAYNMSKFLRRYARYINVKGQTYRSLGIDFCRVTPQTKMRDVTMEQLINVLPMIQNQFDTLLAFDASRDDLCNGIINSAFNILYKDFVKLYITYQALIIRLLELFFFTDNLKDANELLNLYKKFLVRMNKVSEFMPVVHHVGLYNSDMPHLSRVPSLSLKMLEKRVESLEIASKRAHDRSLGRIEYGTLGRARRRSFKTPSRQTPIRQSTIDILSPMAVMNYKKRNEELKHLDKMMDISNSDKEAQGGSTNHQYDLLSPQNESNKYEELEGEESGVMTTDAAARAAAAKDPAVNKQPAIDEEDRDLMSLDAVIPTSPIYGKSPQSATQRLLEKSPVMSILE